MKSSKSIEKKIEKLKAKVKKLTYENIRRMNSLHESKLTVKQANKIRKKYASVENIIRKAQREQSILHVAFTEAIKQEELLRRDKEKSVKDNNKKSWM